MEMADAVYRWIRVFAFGHKRKFVHEVRLPVKDGKVMHASVQICGASVMLVDESGLGKMTP